MYCVRLYDDGSSMRVCGPHADFSVGQVVNSYSVASSSSVGTLSRARYANDQSVTTFREIVPQSGGEGAFREWDGGGEEDRDSKAW